MIRLQNWMLLTGSLTKSKAGGKITALRQYGQASFFKH
jgi:hypothetical protein